MATKSDRRTEPSGGVEALQYVELDPALVEPSFLQDRLISAVEESVSLIELIRNHGQLVPILVRPHPQTPGTYEIAYGRRRLRAARELGRPVKAIVRCLTDEELVVAQGQENAARADLSFIERALFASNLENRGFGRETIMAALAVDKSRLSQLISVAASVPRDMIVAIGSAPAIGRPRWLQLAGQLSEIRQLQKARRLVKAKQFAELGSDDRFVHILRETGEAVADAPEVLRLPVDEVVVGSVEKGDKTTVFRIDHSAAPGFDCFLQDRMADLFGEWRRSCSDEGPKPAPPRRTPRARKPVE